MEGILLTHKLNRYFLTVKRVGTEEMHVLDVKAENEKDAKKVIEAKPDYRLIDVERRD